MGFAFYMLGVINVHPANSRPTHPSSILLGRASIC